MKVNNKFLKNKYFPSKIIEWDKLDPNICDSLSYPIFKKRISEATTRGVLWKKAFIKISQKWQEKHLC